MKTLQYICLCTFTISFCFALLFMSLCFSLQNSLSHFLQSRSTGDECFQLLFVLETLYISSPWRTIFLSTVLLDFFFFQLCVITLLPVLWDVCWESGSPLVTLGMTTHLCQVTLLLLISKLLSLTLAIDTATRVSQCVFLWVWSTWHFSRWVWEMEVMWTWTFISLPRISEII